MTIQLRPYQQKLEQETYDAWNAGHRNVLIRAACGSGKTALFSKIASDWKGAVCIEAHRNELVEQISLTLGRYGVQHNLIASTVARRQIAHAHVELLGQCFYQPGSSIAVASVDTIVRAKGLEQWAAQVTLVIPDEAAHVLRSNKWGKSVEIFTNPARRMILPTATPIRADGLGLGSHADGYADIMIEGPPERWLIDNGYLADYDIACPPSDMRIIGEIPASGDWSPKQLREAARASHIVGDVVATYLQLARGRLSVTFAPDVETATEMTAAFNRAGVPAALLTGTTNPAVRIDILKKYRRRQILQLVTVDIVSEGFDLPAMEVAILARRTESLNLFIQQFMRPMRIDPESPGKRALIIDHVGNVVTHLPPDRPRVWSTDRRDKRAKAEQGPEALRICIECIKPYRRIEPACPYCGCVPIPAGRSSPKQVDGELGLLDPAVLAVLQGRVAEVDATLADEQWRLESRHVPPLGIMAGVKRHRIRQEAQAELRAAMARWGGIWHAAGESDAKIQRRFFHTWGIDILSAMALGADDATTLKMRIDEAVISG